jgi:hypothetical protein
MTRTGDRFYDIWTDGQTKIQPYEVFSVVGPTAKGKPLAFRLDPEVSTVAPLKAFGHSSLRDAITVRIEPLVQNSHIGPYLSTFSPGKHSGFTHHAHRSRSRCSSSPGSARHYPGPPSPVVPP